MADGITLNAGTGGSTLLTDDTGAGGHAQVVKLAISTDGSATLIPAEATNGLDVDVTRIQAGDNLIGRVKISDGTDVALVTAGGLLQVDASGAAVPVTDNSGSLTVDNAGTFAVQVDSALPAGANAIGKLAANSGVDIGDVDVTSVVPGTGATNLGKAEDAAHTTGDVGVMALTVRQDTAAALSGTDADYQPLISDASGRLHVNVGNTVTVGSHAVTNAGTFAVQVDGSALTALQLIDDPVVQDDTAFTPATTKVMMAGFEADEGSTDSVDEGDAGAARMTLDRKLITTIQPHTAGGLSTFMASGSDGSTALTSTAQVIKASAGQLYGYYVYNPNSSAQFVHFYNTAAASVTVGTTNPLFTLTVPATAAANLMFPHGVIFSNAGWSCAATATAGGNGAPSTALDLVVWYA